MAVIPVSIVTDAHGYTKATWPNMQNGDTGQPIKAARYPDKTIQATGNFSGSANVAVQGSNDGSTYGALKNIQGNSIGLTNVQPEFVVENPEYLYPEVTVGDGSTLLDVSVVML